MSKEKYNKLRYFDVFLNKILLYILNNHYVKKIMKIIGLTFITRRNKIKVNSLYDYSYNGSVIVFVSCY